MHVLPQPQASPPERSAEIVSFADLNRARSHRVLDRGEDDPVEAHPWAYCFPRTTIQPLRR